VRQSLNLFRATHHTSRSTGKTYVPRRIRYAYPYIRSQSSHRFAELFCRVSTSEARCLSGHSALTGMSVGRVHFEILPQTWGPPINANLRARNAALRRTLLIRTIDAFIDMAAAQWSSSQGPVSFRPLRWPERRGRPSALVVGGGRWYRHSWISYWVCRLKTTDAHSVAASVFASIHFIVSHFEVSGCLVRQHRELGLSFLHVSYTRM
jgi:hypothetical protein